jgi:hypothetical protein
MKFATEISVLPKAYNADARSAARALSKIDFQQVLKEANAQRPAVPQPAAAQPAAVQTALASSPAETPPVARPADMAVPRFSESFVNVKSGDTLVSIAQKALQARGLESTPQAAMRAALQLARDNNLPDANLIVPGQRIAVNSLTGSAAPSVLASSNAGGTRLEGQSRTGIAVPGTESKTDTNVAQKTPHPILEKTLDRAVSLQYFSATEKEAVRSKILDLAAEHHFSPDDLAVVTLIESNGMNPKASNGRCHGVIQFCDGSNRGAASVGFKNNPKAILDLSVLDQLDLVGKYFDETGLKNFGKNKPASLDDLYLTVLTPAARRERNINAYLDIAGQQANVLKTDSEPNAPITRKTLLQGLRQNARDKLSMNNHVPNPVNTNSTHSFQQSGNNSGLIKVSAVNGSSRKSSL